MLKQGKTYIAMQILHESLVKIHLGNCQHLDYKSKVFHLEQISSILFPNDFVWEKFEVSLISCGGKSFNPKQIACVEFLFSLISNLLAAW